MVDLEVVLDSVSDCRCSVRCGPGLTVSQGFLMARTIDLCKHGLDTEMTTTALKVNVYTSETRIPTTITLSLFDGPVH